MEVLKQTSPDDIPSAPNPKPYLIDPSENKITAVFFEAAHEEPITAAFLLAI